MYMTREQHAQYMREHRAEKRRRIEAATRVEKLQKALEEIRALSNYPGEGRSSFADLAQKRRRINKIACDALKKEG